jgi:anti-sigma factor RsiW
MDCRQFCDQHLAFVDDTLAGIELVRMQRHLAECERCARQDAKIRRALLLFRNIAPIEPSPDFTRRLESRLRECHSEEFLPTAHRNLMRGAIAATVASALMLGYIGSTLYNEGTTRDMLLAPVVAMAPEVELTPIATATPAIVASVSAGLSIWPATLFAEQVPVRFAESKLEFAEYSR